MKWLVIKKEENVVQNLNDTENSEYRKISFIIKLR